MDSLECSARSNHFVDFGFAMAAMVAGGACAHLEQTIFDGVGGSSGQGRHCVVTVTRVVEEWPSCHHRPDFMPMIVS